MTTTKTAKKETAKKSAAKKTSAKKNSLVANINRKKKAGTSRPKSRSTVDAKSYAKMEAGLAGLQEEREEDDRKEARREEAGQEEVRQLLTQGRRVRGTLVTGSSRRRRPEACGDLRRAPPPSWGRLTPMKKPGPRPRHVGVPAPLSRVDGVGEHARFSRGSAPSSRCAASSSGVRVENAAAGHPVGIEPGRRSALPAQPLRRLLRARRRDLRGAPGSTAFATATSCAVASSPSSFSASRCSKRCARSRRHKIASARTRTFCGAPVRVEDYYVWCRRWSSSRPKLAVLPQLPEPVVIKDWTSNVGITATRSSIASW